MRWLRSGAPKAQCTASLNETAHIRSHSLPLREQVYGHVIFETTEACPAMTVDYQVGTARDKAVSVAKAIDLAQAQHQVKSRLLLDVVV